MSVLGPYTRALQPPTKNYIQKCEYIGAAQPPKKNIYRCVRTSEHHSFSQKTNTDVSVHRSTTASYSLPPKTHTDMSVHRSTTASPRKHMQICPYTGAPQPPLKNIYRHFRTPDHRSLPLKTYKDFPISTFAAVGYPSSMCLGLLGSCITMCLLFQICSRP